VFQATVGSPARHLSAREASRPSAWRRARLVLTAVLLVVGSVAAQAMALTPVAIVLLVAAAISLSPLALPAADR
jgi:hypothetical protein